MCYNNKMFRIIVFISLLLLVGCSAETQSVVIPQTQSEPEVEYIRTIKVGSIYPSDSPMGVFLESFAVALEEVFDGEIQVNVYHDGFLGDNERHRELLDSGGLDYAIIHPEEDDPLHTVMSTPYLFNDESIDNALEIINEHDPANTIHRVLYYLNCGSVGVASNEQFRNMEDIPPMPQENLIEIESFSYVNEYSIGDNNNFFADIDYYYDIGMFSESNSVNIMFNEHQAVRDALELAIESLEEFTQADNDFIIYYTPVNHEQFVQDTLSTYQTLYEDEAFLETIAMLEEVLPSLPTEIQQEQS